MDMYKWHVGPLEGIRYGTYGANWMYDIRQY
jgi:hypothetical protein